MDETDDVAELVADVDADDVAVVVFDEVCVEDAEVDAEDVCVDVALEVTDDESVDDAVDVTDDETVVVADEVAVDVCVVVGDDTVQCRNRPLYRLSMMSFKTVTNLEQSPSRSVFTTCILFNVHCMSNLAPGNWVISLTA